MLKHFILAICILFSYSTVCTPQDIEGFDWPPKTDDDWNYLSTYHGTVFSMDGAGDPPKIPGTNRKYGFKEVYWITISVDGYSDKRIRWWVCTKELYERFYEDAEVRLLYYVEDGWKGLEGAVLVQVSPPEKATTAENIEKFGGLKVNK